MIMGKYMLSLKEILKNKGGSPVIVSESSNVASAIRTMYEYQVGSVIVVQSQTGQPIGILTERDVIKLYAEGVNNFEKILVRDCMNTEMTVGHQSDPVSEVLAIMTVKRFRHMPVVEGSKMVGVVSIGDLVKAKLEEAVQEAQILRDYISF
jgi:CBS domain-containing protein